MDEERKEVEVGETTGTKPATTGRRGKREIKPPEELYDLTKDIPKVEKPNEEEHKKQLEAISSAIDALKETKNILQRKIDSASDPSNDTARKEREELKPLRAKKGALIEEKKVIQKSLEVANAQLDKSLNERKAISASMTHRDPVKIDEEIAKLKKIQQTTSMSLNDEKKLLKEIDNLQSSKPLVAQMKAKDMNIDALREQIKALKSDIAAKDKEIDAVQKDIEEKSAALKLIGESKEEAKKNRKKNIDDRDELRNQIEAKLKERNELREKFREATDQWFDYQRAMKAKKKLQREEEMKKKEEERLAKIAKEEEEELKKTPYEEEMALCDYLAEHLSRTYLSDKDKKSKEGSHEGGDNIKSSELPDEKNPFANVKPANKKTDDVFLQIGKSSSSKNTGKQSRPSSVTTSKKPTKNVTPTFKLNLDIFEQFAWLNMDPPMNWDSVESSIEQLKEKKIWYSQQPRGTVPTARDLRKAKERTSKQQEGSSNEITGTDFSSSHGGTGAKVKTMPEKKRATATVGFDLSSDEQFAPLTSVVGTTSTTASSWTDSKAKDSTDSLSEEVNEAE